MDQPDVTDQEAERMRRAYSRRIAERGVPIGDACVSPESMIAMMRREGTEEKRLATLEHIMSCAACHREYQWLQAVDQAGTEAGGGTDRQPARWQGRALALAASLVAVVAAGLLLRNRLSSGSETVRGEDGDIVLVAPAAGAGPTGDLGFVWRPLPEASSYVLEVQRRDGSIAFSDTTSDTVLTLNRATGALPDGDYRWWVREVTDGAEPRSSDLRPLDLSKH